MNEYIKEETFLGEFAVRAGNDKMEFIVVPSWGSNVISLTHKESNKELLRVPNTTEAFWMKPSLYGVPILFPPNRLKNGRFTFNGRTYQFDKPYHSHGFLYKNPWKLVNLEKQNNTVIVETEFHIKEYPTIYKQFPHDAVIRMTYLLQDQTLHLHATIYNNDSEVLPWGLGYHTSFLFNEEESKFSLTADQQWELDEEKYPTGIIKELPYKKQLQKGMSLKNWKLDDAYVSSVSNSEKNEAIIYHPNEGVKITYQADLYFKHWVVFNARSELGILCPEPYTWITNAPNLDLPASITGIQALEPGNKITVKTSITVST